MLLTNLDEFFCRVSMSVMGCVTGNRWMDFVGDLDHDMDTGIFFRKAVYTIAG